MFTEAESEERDINKMKYRLFRFTSRDLVPASVLHPVLTRRLRTQVIDDEVFVATRDVSKLMTNRDVRQEMVRFYEDSMEYKNLKSKQQHNYNEKDERYMN